MTNEKAIYFLDKRKKELLEKQDSKEGFEFIKALAEIRSLEMAIKALEQTDKIEESNFSTEQYKADLQGAYDCGYNSGYADARNDIAESEGQE